MGRCSPPPFARLCGDAITERIRPGEVEGGLFAGGFLEEVVAQVRVSRFVGEIALVVPIDLQVGGRAA